MIFSMLVRRIFNFNGNSYNDHDWIQTYYVTYIIVFQFYRLLGIALRLKSKARICKHPCKKQLKHFCCFPNTAAVLCASCLFRKKNPNILSLLLTACWVSVAGGLLNGDKTDIMYLTSLFLCWKYFLRSIFCCDHHLKA